MMRFEGKTVLVTGAASGIGLATAIEFVREGAILIASDINEEGLETAFAEIIAEGRPVTTQYQDVTDRDAWDRVVDDIVARHHGLDVLFNNAGGGHFALFDDTSLEQWRYVNALNLDSVFFGMQAAIRVMQEKGGAIVNNSSVAAMIGEPLLAAYGATKGGVRALTKAVAVDCARRGLAIRVNSIHAGLTNTPVVRNALAGRTEAAKGGDGAKGADASGSQSISVIPMGRLAEPREIARPVLFLASDDASYLTGSELVVDGGYIAQ